ncbi:MAG: methylenetetrahydrofolate--tRNA-(uracil(54)-C(5))-methyltransferase (FADH(2)-oxidizing) TrmFO [Pseudomonadota bacterium]
MNSTTGPITIVGGGLAGCEAAWQTAGLGIRVRLMEMKPHRYSPAHTSKDLAELVCSNSLRSAALTSAAGLLKEELRILGSLIMEAAEAVSVPAGKALAVDRGLFSRYITERLEGHELIEVRRGEIRSLPSEKEGLVIVAGGPLTSDALAGSIAEAAGSGGLSFYDAIAPIVEAESLDMGRLFNASRYEDGEGDYLNAAMDETQYRRFVQAVLDAEKVEPHPFEKIPHFEGCLPVEELARRGPETLAFGPMKPVGLVDPATGERPYAVVQLRAENRERTLFNLVGFQTKMTHGAQERVFRMIPGLENAVFARLGSVHRNTYLDAPNVLDQYSRLRSLGHVFFAGQITGVEGYVESTASGLAVGLAASFTAMGLEPELPPSTTAMGALMKHTRTIRTTKYEPMNVNFGLIEPAPKGVPRKKRKEFIAERAINDIKAWKERLDVALNRV